MQRQPVILIADTTSYGVKTYSYIYQYRTQQNAKKVANLLTSKMFTLSPAVRKPCSLFSDKLQNFYRRRYCMLLQSFKLNIQVHIDVWSIFLKRQHASQVWIDRLHIT